MQENKFRDWVNQEVEKKLDKESFFNLPLKMRIGIVLLVFSFIYGYGVSLLVLVISGINKQLSMGILSGSFVYVSSWIIGAVGLALAGKDCIKYPFFFFAKFAKMLFPKYFENTNPPAGMNKE